MTRVGDIMRTMDYGTAPEADAPVRQWLSGRQPFGHFIGGRFVPSADGASFEVVAPADGTTLARVAQGGAADVDAAVAAARRAGRRWSALPGNARARYLYALARLLQ